MQHTKSLIALLVLLCLPAFAQKTKTPAEIVRVLAAMQKLDAWNLPADIASDLDDWERQINQHGIEHRDSSTEDVFR